MGYVGISKAPDDPEERKEWARQMADILIGMWLSDGATCAECGHTYSSVEDFRRCNPKRGYGKQLSFVCTGCWNTYEAHQKRL